MLWSYVQRQRSMFEDVWSRSATFDVEWLILTPDYFEQLNSLDFSWRSSPSNDPTITAAAYKVKYNKAYIAHKRSWENYYLALSECKLKHGNYDVDKRAPLQVWLKDQRNSYVRATMMPEQVERFNSLGIDLAVRRHKWYSRYDVLYSYQLKHGNTHIPQSFRGNLTLNAWVTEQKLIYDFGRRVFNFDTKQPLRTMRKQRNYRNKRKDRIIRS